MPIYRDIVDGQGRSVSFIIDHVTDAEITEQVNRWYPGGLGASGQRAERTKYLEANRVKLIIYFGRRGREPTASEVRYFPSETAMRAYRDSFTSAFNVVHA